jgi:hypothetical protein
MILDSRSLSYVFQNVLNVEYSNNKELFDAVVEHFTMQTSISKFHKKLETLVDFKKLDISPSQFRISLAESGQAIFNMRFYACYLSGYRGLDANVAEESYTKYDLCRCDAVRIYQSVKKLRTDIKKKYVSLGHTFKSFDPKQFNLIRVGFDKHYENITRFIRFKTKKKLRFIYQFNNMDKKDFHAELLICALRAYYLLHPCTKSDEYVCNYLRSSVNNKVVNLIEYYTTEKRQNLVGSGEGEKRTYQLNVVAESQMFINYDSEGQEIPVENYYDESALTKLISDFDYSVDRWLNKFGETRKGFVLSVFIGREVEKFTEWLKAKRLLRSADKTSQDFICSKSRSEAMQIVGKYIDRDEKYIMSCLREAAIELGVSV